MNAHHTLGTVVSRPDSHLLEVQHQDGEIIGMARRDDSDATTAMLIMMSCVKTVGFYLPPIIDITIDVPGMRARILHEEGIEYIDIEWDHTLA